MPLCRAVGGPDVAAREKNQKVMNLIFRKDPVSTSRSPRAWDSGGEHGRAASK